MKAICNYISWPRGIMLKSTLLLLAAGWSTGGIPPAVADDFRVESKVYAGKDDAPSGESLTLFAGDRAYDFLSSPQEITVFDFSRDEIALLDPVRKVRTELTSKK